MVLATQRPANTLTGRSGGREIEEKAEQRLGESEGAGGRKGLPIRCCVCLDPTGNASLTISGFAWLLPKC